MAYVLRKAANRAQGLVAQQPITDIEAFRQGLVAQPIENNLGAVSAEIDDATADPVVEDDGMEVEAAQEQTGLMDRLKAAGGGAPATNTLSVLGHFMSGGETPWQRRRRDHDEPPGGKNN